MRPTLLLVVAMSFGCAHFPEDPTKDVCKTLEITKTVLAAEIAATEQICPTLKDEHRERCDKILVGSRQALLAATALYAAQCPG